MAAAAKRLNSPRGLVFDPGSILLFVADYSNSRVIVFDVASIINGENAVNVLGQTPFAASSGATMQNRLRDPVGVGLNTSRGWLFVGDNSNHRVFVQPYSPASRLPRSPSSRPFCLPFPYTRVGKCVVANGS